jgi:HK97 family phage major capsid protein
MTTREQKLELLKKQIAGIETRANEAMTTGQDGFGQDFVPTDLASTILAKVRDANTFVSKISAPIIMPTATYTIPVEGSDPTWIATGEQANVTGTAVTTSKAGTEDLVLTAKKYSASVYTS